MCVSACWGQKKKVMEEEGNTVSTNIWKKRWLVIMSTKLEEWNQDLNPSPTHPCSPALRGGGDRRVTGDCVFSAWLRKCQLGRAPTSKALSLKMESDQEGI